MQCKTVGQVVRRRRIQILE